MATSVRFAVRLASRFQGVGLPPRLPQLTLSLRVRAASTYSSSEARRQSFTMAAQCPDRDPESDTVVDSAQTTDTLLMIRPTYFNYNTATAVDNQYQSVPEHLRLLQPEDVSALAVQEADRFASVLRENGLRVIQVDPLEEQSDCSDAVFPNNWISFHEGRIAVYPMMAENRRKERRWDLVHRLSEQLNADIFDYTFWESEEKFLEGTGSMVLDRTNKICYACLSQRTDPNILQQFCHDFGYHPVTFEAFQATADGQQWPVYHTNVICAVGDSFALLCTKSIRDPKQRERVVETMEETGKDVIDVEEHQVYKLVSNCLQVHTTHGKRCLVMSSGAHSALRRDQLAAILRHVDQIIHAPLSTIETLGGGGARCMLAEVFYKNK